MARKIMKVGDSDVINKSQRGLLKQAKRKLNKLVLRDLKDEVGRFGFEVDTHLVGARSYIYGYILSAHKTLVGEALRKNKKILIYIGDADKFYEFDPKLIRETGTIVKRGSSEMFNYDVKLGKFYEV